MKIKDKIHKWIQEQRDHINDPCNKGEELIFEQRIGKDDEARIELLNDLDNFIWNIFKK